MLDAETWRLVRIIYPILASVAVIGICLNTILLLTTWVTKSLRSTANRLIGFCAFFDIIHQMGYLIQFPILFSDYYIDSFYCTSMIFVPELGLAAGACCVLSLGFDRMLSIVLLKHGRFLKFYFIPIALFCGWCGYLMIAYYTPQQLICAMPAPYHGDSFSHWSLSLSIVNGLSVIVYFVMWQAAKSKGVSAHSKRIMLSIVIVAMFEVTAWLIYSILINLSLILIADPDRRPPFHKTSCLFVNIGIAVKTIVYYGISLEYRRAIRAFLGLKMATSTVYSEAGTSMQTQTLSTI